MLMSLKIHNLISKHVNELNNTIIEYTYLYEMYISFITSIVQYCIKLKTTHIFKMHRYVFQIYLKTV